MWRPNRHQQHSARIDRLFEGALQHHHIEEAVEDVHHKHSSLEQCQKQRGNMIRVIKSPYLNTPQLLDVDRSKVHPLVRNLFHMKERQAPLAGRLKFYSENWEKLTQDVSILSIVQGFKIAFPQTPFQFGPPQLARVKGYKRYKFRNNGNVEKRCNSTGEIRTWEISEQFVLSKQEGWRLSGCNKSQISEQLHTIPTFQNGSDAFNKGSPPRTQLFNKDRSKGGLFWHTSRQKFNKIYSFSVGRKFIRIPLLMFWSGSSPFDFHKTSDDPNCLIKEDQCKNNNSFGRHVSNGPNVERDFASKGDIDFSVTKFRFCYKF